MGHLRENAPFLDGLPFFPLPEEMPKRSGTSEGVSFVDLPSEELDNRGVLFYGAAMANLASFESWLEVKLREAWDKE